MKKAEYQPEPGEIVLCDPDYSPEDAAAGHSPKCVIRANVLKVLALIGRAHVEIMDEYRNGKRIWANTDRYGSTCYVLLKAVAPLNE